MENQYENLLHNIAGTLSAMYVNYLFKMCGGRVSNDYCIKNFTAEYKSRLKRMQENPELVVVFNSYNEFYNETINENGESKKKWRDLVL